MHIKSKALVPHHKMFLTLSICSLTFCLTGMGELPSSETLWLCAGEEKRIDGCYGWMKVTQWMRHNGGMMI